MDRLFLETKVLADDAGLVSGIAWKFGAADRVGDMIEPGAFAKAALPLPMLFGHDANDPVGTWDQAVEKSDGLHLTGKLLVDEVERAREVRALVRSGAVRGISIGFVTRIRSCGGTSTTSRSRSTTPTTSCSRRARAATGSTAPWQPPWPSAGRCTVKRTARPTTTPRKMSGNGHMREVIHGR